MKKIIAFCTDKKHLVLMMIIALAIGAAFAFIAPGYELFYIFGTLFIGCLKGVAPLLVFVLVMSSLVDAAKGIGKKFALVICLYLGSTLLAAMLSVIISFAFPITLNLTRTTLSPSAPSNIYEIVKSLLSSLVQNPVKAISSDNFIGILFWSIITGLSIRKVGSNNIKNTIKELANIISDIVRFVISLAPIGIFSIVYKSISTSGIEVFTTYSSLVLELVITMLIVALILNPLIVFCFLKKNPYPLVFKCLKRSGVTAFFTRSSAANVPVNLDLCDELGVDKNMSSVSIPLGATINMNGAAIVITIMTLAAVNTLNINVNLPMAILCSIVATLAACGTSGVAGGSLLLIPLACSLFNISNEIAMQVVAVGFVISVIQDSFETALNSSADVLFTATADYYIKEKGNK